MFLKMFKVKLKKDDVSNGLKKGDEFDAQTYFIDPSKVTIYDKSGEAICNQYRSDIEILNDLDID